MRPIESILDKYFSQKLGVVVENHLHGRFKADEIVVRDDSVLKATEIFVREVRVFSYRWDQSFVYLVCLLRDGWGDFDQTVQEYLGC